MDQEKTYAQEPPAGSWAPTPGGGTDPSHRRRPPVRRAVLALVGIAAVSGVGAGVAAAATSGGSGTAPGTSQGTAPGATPGGAPGTGPGGTRPHFGFGPGGMGPGGMGPGGMRPGGMGGMGAGGAIHGEFVRPAPGGSGYQTVDVQSGKVTAVSSSSITVQSADGFTRTYDVTADTLVDAGRDGISNVKTDDQVTLTAVVANGTATASNVMDRTNLASIRQAWGG